MRKVHPSEILTGKIDDYEGSFRYGHNVNPGYYDQEQEGLNPNNTVIDEVWSADEKLTQTEIRNVLAMFCLKGRCLKAGFDFKRR